MSLTSHETCASSWLLRCAERESCITMLEPPLVQTLPSMSAVVKLRPCCHSSFATPLKGSAASGSRVLAA